jgi:hypothetical protein
MARRRRRIDRKGPDRYTIDLPAEERALLRQLLPQLRELVSAPPSASDERVRRLFPTAYPDDAERDAEYQRFMRDELVTSRVSAIVQVEESLDARQLTEAELVAWMQSVNSIRLVLGTLLDISEDLEVDDLPDDDPNLPDYALYGYLSMLLDEIVTALSRGM